MAVGFNVEAREEFVQSFARGRLTDRKRKENIEERSIPALEKVISDGMGNQNSCEHLSKAASSTQRQELDIKLRVPQFSWAVIC